MRPARAKPRRETRPPRLPSSTGAARRGACRACTGAKGGVFRGSWHGTTRFQGVTAQNDAYSGHGSVKGRVFRTRPHERVRFQDTIPRSATFSGGVTLETHPFAARVAISLPQPPPSPSQPASSFFLCFFHAASRASSACKSQHGREKSLGQQKSHRWQKSRGQYARPGKP